MANQSQNFLALLSNFDTAIGATETALNSEGSALQENNRYMESLSAKVQSLKATFQDLATNVIENDLIKALLDLANNVLKALNTEVGQTITQVALITTGLTGLIGVGRYIVGPILGGIASAFTGATVAAGGFMATVAPLAAILGAVAVAGWNLYKDLSTSSDELNENLTTNKQRLDEINDIPWYDRTTEILEEKKALEEENAVLQARINKTKELNELNKSTPTLFDAVGVGKKTTTEYEVIGAGGLKVAEEEKKKYEELGYAVREVRTEVELTGEAYNDYLIEDGKEYISVLKEQGELNDKQIADFAELNPKLQERAEALKAYSESGGVLNEQQKTLIAVADRLNKVFEETGNNARAASDAFTITASEAEILRSKSEALAGVIENNNGVLSINAEKLFNVKEQTAETRKSIADLIAEETIFNQTNLNVRDKIGQLYSLAQAAGATASSLAMLSNVSSVMEKVDRPGMTGTERMDYVRSQLGSVDLSSVVKDMWSKIEYDSYTPPISTPVFSGSGTTGGGSKGSSRPEKDPNLTNFQSSYEALKHNLELGLIAEEDYYNQLEQLIANYMATAKADEKEMYRYQEEVYKGRQKLAQETAEAEKKAAQEALNAQKEALEAYASYMIENIEEQLKKYRKKREDRIKYYDEEIEKLQEVNDETERNIHLGELQENLAKAKQTKMLVYKDGRYQYIQDIGAVSAAQAELDAYDREETLRKEVERIENLKNKEVKHIDDLISEWESYRDEWSDLARDYKKSQDRLLIEQQLGINLENDNWNKRLANAQDFVDKYNELMGQVSGGVGDSNGMSDGSEYNASASIPGQSSDVPITISPSGQTQQTDLPVGTIVHTAGGDYRITGGTGKPGDRYTSEKVSAYATGSLGASGGMSLVGENGPELRVLGSGDGILPADVTKNLWAWGSMTPASLISAISGGFVSGGQTMSVVIDNINLPNVQNGQDFVNYLKNNFWSKTLQFANA